MDVIVISIVTGVVSGIVASLIVWWYLFHYLAPKIEFSPIIAKALSKDRGCGYYYQFMITNIGHRRAIDLSVDILLVIRSFPEEGTDNIYHPHPSTKALLELLSAAKSKNVRRRLWIGLDEEGFVEKFTRSYFPDDIKKLATERKLSLEDLLSMGENSFLRVLVKATDDVSGSVKVFQSKDYSAEDIKEGSFIEFSEEFKAPSLLKSKLFQLTKRST